MLPFIMNKNSHHQIELRELLEGYNEVVLRYRKVRLHSMDEMLLKVQYHVERRLKRLVGIVLKRECKEYVCSVIKFWPK